MDFAMQPTHTPKLMTENRDVRQQQPQALEEGMADDILQVKGLRTYLPLDEGILKAVDGADLAVPKRSTVGLIGESGSGKTMLAQSILQIVPPPGKIYAGKILVDQGHGQWLDLAQLDATGQPMRAIRGKKIAMIFQEPMTSLSPVHTIGSQIMEAILLHVTRNKNEARELALDMVARVGIANPAHRLDEYPHQLSGGMRQRAMIAMALSCKPQLLIADEPTTALDVTVQAQILDLMRSLQQQLGMAILYITHDLGVIAEIAEETNVMYLGRIVEQGPTVALFDNPLHPYTRLLLKSIPRVGRKARRRLEAIEGNVPVPLNPPRRCGFFDRCPEAMVGICDQAVPALVNIGDQKVRCFLWSDQKEPEDD
jgi:peptide/nickel transport system ATP-binding protein